MTQDTGQHVFLSTDWLAAALKLRQELINAAPSTTRKAKVNLIVTNLPCEQDFNGTELHAHIDTQAGGLLPLLGTLEDAAATIQLDYAAALGAFIADDPQVIMHGFLNGTLQVTGDLLLVLTMFEHPDELLDTQDEAETSNLLAQEQKEFTRYAQARLRAITKL